jgi:CheY-like chemotaxis protein/anti-sigma regulatory factor (Ser/Thr protein kinase)
MANKKHLELGLTFDNRVTLIEGDERRLKEILINLLTNAIKFTPEGGKIGLEVVGDVENDAVGFTVWDTGIGIAPENISRVFQPFVQVDSGLARQYTGAGLGLALVRRMVEMHDGRISVTSELGKGSRFTVTLPWREMKDGWMIEDGKLRMEDRTSPIEDRTSIDSRSSMPHTAPTILIAEDNEASIEVLCDFLELHHYRLVVARDGHEVIARAQAERPDLILMDIQMPGLHGLEAIRRMRADQNLKTVPIIAMTALAMSGDRELCLAAGADDYLSKPVSLKGLIATIEGRLRVA